MCTYFQTKEYVVVWFQNIFCWTLPGLHSIPSSSFRFDNWIGADVVNQSQCRLASFPFMNSTPLIPYFLHDSMSIAGLQTFRFISVGSCKIVWIVFQWRLICLQPRSHDTIQPSLQPNLPKNRLSSSFNLLHSGNLVSCHACPSSFQERGCYKYVPFARENGSSSEFRAQFILHSFFCLPLPSFPCTSLPPLMRESISQPSEPHSFEVAWW